MALRRSLMLLYLAAALWFQAALGAPRVLQLLHEAEVPASFMAQSRAALSAKDGAGSVSHTAVPLSTAIFIDYSLGKAAFRSHETLWTCLARQLSLAGHNTTVVFSSVEGVDGVMQAKVLAQEKFKGIHNVRIATLPQHKLRYSAPAHVAVAYDVYLWLLESKPQIAYFTDWQGLGHFATIAKRQGLALEDTLLVTLLAGPHIWHGMQAGGSSLSTTSDLEVAFMEASATERSDVVITSSADMITWLEDRGWSFPRDVMITGFYPLTRFEKLPPPPKQTLSEHLDDFPHGVEFVYIGGGTVKDGLALFCSAISRLLNADWELAPFDVAFIGDMNMPMYRPKSGEKAITGREFISEQIALWRTSRQPNLLQGIEIMDDLDTAQMLAYLRGPGKTRVAILPSPSESGGFSMSELLLQGVPFLATNSLFARSLIAPDSHFSTLFMPIARNIAARLRGALISPPPPARPADGLVNAASTWSAWHAALSKAKGAVTGGQGAAREGPEAWFPPGIEILASSFDSEGTTTDAAVTADVQLGADLKAEDLPLVSIVLVTYNRPTLLALALKSLADQTYPAEKFEVVLVDDGSTDLDAIAFLSTLEQQSHWFAQRGWTVVRSPGGYLGNARNRGLQASRGDWVLFMDDDNYAKAHEIMTFVIAANNTGAEALTCFNDYLPDSTAAPDSATIPSGRYVPLGPSSTAAAFRNAIGDANAMFNRSVLLNLGGWPEDDAYAVQDWELLTAAVLKKFRVEVIPEALYWYRTNSGSMIRSKLYRVMNSLPLRSFLQHGDPLLAPAIAVASHQADEASRLRQQVTQLQGAVSSQAQLLKLMASAACSGIQTDRIPESNRLRSSNFEQWTSKGLADQWDAYDSAGYSSSSLSRPGAYVTPEPQNRHSVNVTLTNIGQAGGAIQHVYIGQNVPRPLLLQGWANAVQIVGGSGAPADLSIYADITFQDGTHQWAFHIPINPDLKGWQHGWAIIDAPRPIRLVSVVTMFRWFEGSVVFDDIMLTDVTDGMCYVPLD